MVKERHQFADDIYLVATMHNWASINDATMRTVVIVYPYLLDVGCFSHILDLVGEHFCTPTVTEFGMLWVSLFSHIQSQTLYALEKPSNNVNANLLSYTVVKQVGIIQTIDGTVGDLEQYLKNNDDVAPATRTKLLSWAFKS